MRIVFVRHGYPNYASDCLTEVGHKQAEAVAIRLADEPFTHIYSSTCGRAVETAGHIAQKHDVPVESFDFMREIKWGPIEGDELPHQNGYPWVVAADMVAKGQDVLNRNWMQEEPFVNNKVKFLVENIGQEFDKLLAQHGYTREGDYYRVTKENDETIAMVSHGGASCAAISHLLSLPFPFVCQAFRFRLTSVSVLSLTGVEGRLIGPRVELLDDVQHIKEIGFESYIGPQ